MEISTQDVYKRQEQVVRDNLERDADEVVAVGEAFEDGGVEISAAVAVAVKVIAQVLEAAGVHIGRIIAGAAQHEIGRLAGGDSRGQLFIEDIPRHNVHLDGDAFVVLAVVAIYTLGEDVAEMCIRDR